MRAFLLQFYRIAILVVMAWLLRTHAVRLRAESFRPLTVEEVRQIFPMAHSLALRRANPAAAGACLIAPARNSASSCTPLPSSDSIIGYRGWTNTLVAFVPALHVLGVHLRSSRIPWITSATFRATPTF